jgi:hypothetical protein
MNNFSVLFSSLVQGLNLCVQNEGDKENKCMVDFNLKVFIMKMLSFQVFIMKMLQHPNIVNLIEVIDDPESDNFYMGTDG